MSDERAVLSYDLPRAVILARDRARGLVLLGGLGGLGVGTMWFQVEPYMARLPNFVEAPERDSSGEFGAGDLSAGPSGARDLERCLCAAIRFRDGYIVRGHRHHDCLRSAGEMERGAKGHEAVQGFLTTRGRFVDREEGARLERAAGRTLRWSILYSEDLY